MTKRRMKSMDGNTAAAYASYAFTDVAAIYPITPSSDMAQHIDEWAATGKKNIFGETVQVVEMQSEGGASGAVHGSLQAGALTSTYTSSQGLMLMIPNMFKIAGELLPGVFHVASRLVASNGLGIFCDHSDVMTIRTTGFAMLSSASVQQAMDMAAVAHLSAIKGRVPFLHFFDGFRTSHEIQKFDAIDPKNNYEEIRSLVDWAKVDEFRKGGLNPEHPHQQGTAQNPDIYFQGREAANKYYEATPEIVEEVMKQVGELTGRKYSLFDYVGAPDAERVIIAMGSGCDAIEETINYLAGKGEKVGLVKVHLYRPFSIKHFIAAIPASVKKIAVLDRTKESGSLGEPLYLDVCSALLEAGRSDIKVVGGRYGLGSKEFNPTMVKAVYDNLSKDEPKNHFTVGINDDVTHTSLELGETLDVAPAGTVSCMFYGLGSDGTVGANKNSIKIIGDHTDKYAQAYFAYDSKKSGGITISHLRFGDTPIQSTYLIDSADFIACHNPSYVTKYDMVSALKDGGTFLLNCPWTAEELDAQLPATMKQLLAKKHAKLYTIDAISLAKKVGMGGRINTIMQAAFFKLAEIIPYAQADEYMKAYAKKTYGKKGDAVVQKNWDAIDAGAGALVKIDVPADWANATEKAHVEHLEGPEKTVAMVRNIMEPVGRMNGDSLPVSAFVDYADGTFQQGAAAYEKRGVSVTVPEWTAETCAQCNQCAYVCPHATIRPYTLNAEEAAAAPEGTKMVDHKMSKGKYKYALAVSPLDCMGCSVCVSVCPTKSLKMVGQESQLGEQKVFDYMVKEVTVKSDVAGTDNVIKSQYLKPYLEFSGSCAGCAETSYARLVTQLFGNRMYVSNATGCSSIWGGPAATSPYCMDKNGKGVAWANSLFEDNAENGYGMYLGQKVLREKYIEAVKELIAVPYVDEDIAAAGKEFLDTVNDGEKNSAAAEKLIAAINANPSVPTCECDACKLARKVLEGKNYLAKKSVWIFGGDGWAFDIGFGGLDHVLASGEDVNVFVFNTEVYSNTGGQASKASNIGQVAQFAAAGKEIKSKSLAEIAMTYGYVYVAQVAMGANMAQTLKAIKEAEAWHGPSLIIGYSPCEMHSIKGGMANCQLEMKKAVDCGYWNLFRYNPAAEKPFSLDSKEPKGGYQDFLKNEARYARLATAFPERATELFEKNEENAKARYEHLLKLKALYE